MASARPNSAASFIRIRSGESHFYQLVRLAIAVLAGAMPSGASARPNSAASFTRGRRELGRS